MRILMRASQSPFDNWTPYETLLYDKIWTNFNVVNNGHKERYDNFVRFLCENGLNPVFQPNTVFDNKIEEIPFSPPVHSILSVS